LDRCYSHRDGELCGSSCSEVRPARLRGNVDRGNAGVGEQGDSAKESSRRLEGLRANIDRRARIADTGGTRRVWWCSKAEADGGDAGCTVVWLLNW
jgi:hypothetical protein